MVNNFNELIETLRDIYSKHDKETIEVNPEYVYMTIPAEYVCVYNRILVLLSEYGLDMLNDCKSDCKNRNKTIIQCFNMFNAACAARKLGQTKQAETIIKYINAQLTHLYKDGNVIPTVVYPIDKKGYVSARVTCKELPTFEVDIETGILTQISQTSDSIEFNINDNNNLIVE